MGHVTYQQQDNRLKLQDVGPPKHRCVPCTSPHAPPTQNQEQPKSSPHPGLAGLHLETRQGVLGHRTTQNTPGDGWSNAYQAAPGADEMDPGGVGGLQPVAGGAG